MWLRLHHLRSASNCFVMLDIMLLVTAPMLGRVL